MIRRFCIVILIAIGLMVALRISANATWKPEYANAPQAVRDWYEAQELTPAAQKRFPFKGCCDQSDVVRTKFKVGGVGNDEWWWENSGNWERIPDDIIHWGSHAPDGQATLFVWQGQPTCFYPPDGGI